MAPLTVYTSVDVTARFVTGVAAGIVATLAMDLVMARLPEGTTPPSIAAGVLTDRPPEAAPARLGSVVHYLAGFLTGPLFVWLLFASASVLGDDPTTATSAAAAVLYVLMVGFFAVVVLPQSLVDRERVPAIRRDWAVSAAAYLVVLVAVVVLPGRL
jgi:hypothetical protein